MRRVTETALFVAAFNGEDPGVLAMAQRCAFSIDRARPAVTHDMTNNKLPVLAYRLWITSRYSGGRHGRLDRRTDCKLGQHHPR